MLDFQVSFAGVPFLLNSAKIVRQRFPNKIPEPNGIQPFTQEPITKHQVMADLVDELNRIIDFRYLHDFDQLSNFPGRNLGGIAWRNRIGPHPSPDIKIGDYYYPNTACRWSVYRGLATTTQVAAMYAATLPSSVSGPIGGTFILQQNPVEPDNPDNIAASYTVATVMYMLPPRPLADHGTRFDGLYLVTLVDERYWWQYLSTSLISTNPAGNTWEALIATLSSALGVAINHNAIEAVYQTPEPDSDFYTNTENAAILLDAVAYNTGRVVVRDFSGNYHLYSASDSLTLVNNNRQGTTIGVSIAPLTQPSAPGSPILNFSPPQPVIRVAGGNIFAPVTENAEDLTIGRNYILPSRVEVTFPFYVVGNSPVPHFLNPRTTPPRNSLWYEESFGDTYVIPVPITSGGALVSGLLGYTGFTHTIHSTAKALLPSENTSPVLNSSGLLALSMQLATDYYGQQAGTALDEVYPGTFAWQPEGFHDIVWTYSTRTRIACTRVMRTQWNWMIREMQHSTPSPSGQILNFLNQPTSPFPPIGVGGKQVAQVVRDSNSIGPGHTLANSMAATDLVAVMTAVDNWPTQNRWYGLVDSEYILFEGTAGNTTVAVVYRGLNGSNAAVHAAGSTITQVVPNTTYAPNLITYEKMQFAHPGVWTSGGIQEVKIPTAHQTVYLLEGTGTVLNNITHYSGMVQTYNPTQGAGAQFPAAETCWVIERNAAAPSSGSRYDGQLMGYSVGPTVAPVYGVNVGGGAQGPPGPPGPGSVTICLTSGGNSYAGSPGAGSFGSGVLGCVSNISTINVDNSFNNWYTYYQGGTVILQYGGNNVNVLRTSGGPVIVQGNSTQYTFFPSCTWDVSFVAGVTYIRRLLNVNGGGASIDDVAMISLLPSNAWIVAAGSSCEATVKRVFDVNAFGPDIIGIDFSSNDFTVADEGGGKVSVETKGLTKGGTINYCGSDGLAHQITYQFQDGLVTEWTIA